MEFIENLLTVDTIYYKSKTARTIRKRATMNLFGVVIVNCYGA